MIDSLSVLKLDWSQVLSVALLVSGFYFGVRRALAFFTYEKPRLFPSVGKVDSLTGAKQCSINEPIVFKREGDYWDISYDYLPQDMIGPQMQMPMEVPMAPVPSQVPDMNTHHAVPAQVPVGRVAYGSHRSHRPHGSHGFHGSHSVMDASMVAPGAPGAAAAPLLAGTVQGPVGTVQGTVPAAVPAAAHRPMRRPTANAYQTPYYRKQPPAEIQIISPNSYYDIDYGYGSSFDHFVPQESLPVEIPMQAPPPVLQAMPELDYSIVNEVLDVVYDDRQFVPNPSPPQEPISYSSSEHSDHEYLSPPYAYSVATSASPPVISPTTPDTEHSDAGSASESLNDSQADGQAERFVCPHCRADFRIKGYLTRHLKKHARQKAYTCPFYHADHEHKCHPTGGFSRRDTYKTHLKARHFLYPQHTPCAERANVAGVCAGCKKQFNSNEAWVETHIQTKLCSALS